MKKGIVIGIICLFIGVGIAPSIIAVDDTVNENEDVEVIVQICKVFGMKEYKLKLSIEEYEKLENTFDNLKIKLHNSKTREERISILNNAVVSLDSIGILPNSINIKDIQKLITEDNYNFRFSNLFERLNLNNQPQADYNTECSVSGKITRTEDWWGNKIITKIKTLMAILFCFCPFYWYYLLIPHITFGYASWIEYLDLPIQLEPSIGWLYTDGENGVVNWEGRLYGQLGKEVDYYYIHGGAKVIENWFIGIRKFTGFNIYIEAPKNMSIKYFLGKAKEVSLGLDPPL